MEKPNSPPGTLKLKPMDLPLCIKTILALKDQFGDSGLRYDEIVEDLKLDEIDAERRRQFADDKISYFTRNCHGCPLCQHSEHTQKVRGEGSIKSPLMFIGEGPGFEEDKVGKPFVGKAGQLLTTILNKMNISRERVYITNIIKCRPPKNRTPLREEVKACSKILRLELDIIKPEVVVALGATPLKYFNVDGGITRARGKWLNIDGSWIMPTYHPAYILRLHGKALIDAKWDVWHDFNKALDKANELRPKYRFK